MATDSTSYSNTGGSLGSAAAAAQETPQVEDAYERL